MGRKKDEPKAPIADAYQPELIEMYNQRRRKPGFENLKMNPSSEKFYRLYFYQGVTQGDRVFLHQEFLETQSRRYACTGVVILLAAGTYLGLGLTVKYHPFQAMRIILACISGYTGYKVYKGYATYRLESQTEEFYEKYAIR